MLRPGVQGVAFPVRLTAERSILDAAAGLPERRATVLGGDRAPT